MRQFPLHRGSGAKAAPFTDWNRDDLVPQAPAVSRMEVLRRFWPWVRPDRWKLLLAIMLLAVAAGGEVVSVWVFKDLINDVLVPRHFGAFWGLGATLAVVTTVTALIHFLGQYTATWVAERFILRLRTDCVDHLHTLPPDTLRTRWHGDVLSRMTLDIESIEQFVASGLIQFAAAVISLGVFVTAAFFLSWPLALAVFTAAPVFYLSARFFANRVQDRSREAMRRQGSITGVIEESLANSALAHAYNQQPREVDRVEREGRKLLRADLSAARVAQLYPAFLEVVEVLGGLVVVGFGAFLLTQGALTIGGLIAFAAFLTRLFSPASQLSSMATSFGAAAGGAERIIELLGMRSPVRQRPHAMGHDGWRGELAVENLTAGYATQAERPVLSGVDFTVAPGQVVAVMGPSGAGKSTLAKLLVRFMDPWHGVVRLDGLDLRDLTLHAVRSAVTLLPQDSQDFRASVRDNIAYGRPDAAEQEITEAAKAAGAHEFIEALPQGYQTVLGQDGLQLSGGQARRIGLARAFLRSTAVLVLDEPTAGLDKEAALALVPPLRRLMAGHTTVLITHDPVLAGQADAIYLLDADGTPAVAPAGNGSTALRGDGGAVSGPARPGGGADGPATAKVARRTWRTAARQDRFR